MHSELDEIRFVAGSLSFSIRLRSGKAVRNKWSNLVLSSLAASSPDRFLVGCLVTVFLGTDGKESAGGFGCLKVCLAVLNALFSGAS